MVIPTPVMVELSSRGQRVRGPAFGTVRRGAWVPTGTDLLDPDVRIAAVAAQLPPHAVVGGWSAARLHELATGAPDPVFDGGRRWQEARADGPVARVVVCAARHSRLAHRPDVRVFRSPVPEESRARVLGVVASTPARTALDMARLLPVTSGVIAVDRMLALGLLTVDELAALVLAPGQWQGRAAARRVLDLCAPGTESPQESVLRLLWLDAGLPRPMVNARVLDPAGRFVARVDLLDPDAGVVGEYDGGVHSGSARRSTGAARQESLEELGLLVVRATSVDVGDSGARAWQARLRAAYGRASRRPAAARRWVVVP
ncbi:hypothetical protein [Actinotalea solisilvae]|uniref:hypothetical protein n=1 Tax=Actinotalea solisilvae TaxID=2072922 RepID=UPI0018F10C30|nr:hypothetical protein [Actinotalea solisilvae]